SQDCEQWWRSMFEQWAFTLDILIWLNAPDTILVDRINTRSQRHAVKGKSELKAYTFLNDYRTSLEEVISELISVNSMIRVLHFDSSRENPVQIAEGLVTVFSLG
ncbi:MAG: hypothetical protein ACREBU_09710, partial [Nitrososphaera sp.]